MIVTKCSLHFGEHQKKNQVHHQIYFCFNQVLEEKSYICPKIEAVFWNKQNSVNDVWYPLM